ncbi:TetR/AcrR family transcriptional regulator [Microbacterium sp. ASV81]|uniref:TetR family transcriptional regulator n=1 Tax=Microbacterium capsulatum TaxID=3041921 RepID=A0ABU0XIJ6_9MICO|nr:TetR family transcriptional regulator [Microbacterium sp. ASV81]MDQ4214926.1 TetR family transcriptional regulator [Microbacterium sp. ASV81]
MTTFQRARSEEQREIRRRAILETTATMLAETPVADISLNELSRRVGLAKSNVLRYFESREAILLDLLDQLAHDLFVEIRTELPAAVDPGDDLRQRVSSAATTAAAAIARHEMLCELVSAQAGVLEHNVTAETVTRYKRAGYASLAGFADVLHQVIPELTGPQAAEAARAILIAVGAYWTHAHPPKAVQETYELDPTLVFLPDGFQGSLERVIAVLILGVLTA